MMKGIEHLSLPRSDNRKSLYIASFDPCNCFVRERFLVSFYTHGLAGVNITPTCYGGRSRFNLGISDPRSLAHSPPPGSFPGDNVEVWPG